MRSGAPHLLRVGLAVTFLWIGVLILRDPAGWGALIRPGVASFLPVPVRTAMLSTAVLDLVVGLLLLTDILTWLAASVAAVHLAVVLATVGIDPLTVRDLGLLAAAAALALLRWPWR